MDLDSTVLNVPLCYSIISRAKNNSENNINISSELWNIIITRKKKNNYLMPNCRTGMVRLIGGCGLRGLTSQTSWSL